MAGEAAGADFLAACGGAAHAATLASANATTKHLRIILPIVTYSAGVAKASGPGINWHLTILSRYIFREIVSSALLGTVLFTFVLFLRNVGQLFELLVRRTATGEIVLYLFALMLPQTLTFTIPMGVLVGILIGLGRMSGDGEVIATRAAGIPTRRFILPVTAFALLGLSATAAVSLYVKIGRAHV